MGGQAGHVGRCRAVVGDLGDEGMGARAVADFGGGNGVGVGQRAPGSGGVAGVEVGAGGVDEVGGPMLGG